MFLKKYFRLYICKNIYLQLLDDVHNVSTRYENPKLENPIRKTTSSTQ